MLPTVLSNSDSALPPHALLRYLSSTSVHIAVRSSPGHTVLTLMLAGPSSSASACVSAITANLLAQYADSPPREVLPAIDAILTIAPSLLRNRCGIAALEHKNGPLALTAITRSHASSENSATGPDAMMPALLTRMSTEPSAFT